MSIIKPALERPELISYFSGANNYSWLHFRNGEKKLLAKPISYLANKLPDFVRAHKTVLINPAYVKSLHQPLRQKMAGEIRLDSGEVFPVSRRRWTQVADSLHGCLVPAGPGSVTNNAVDSVSVPVVPQYDRAMRYVLLVTDDEPIALFARQLIEERWPAYQLHTTQQSSYLADVFRPLSTRKNPAFILMDARTKTRERLQTLQHLKEDPKLSRIPLILLVSNTDQSVTEAYERKANSVISLSDNQVALAQVIERICQFWLKTVTLPAEFRDESP